MQHRIITADYHRNGVGGAGFNVAIVESDTEEGRARFLCIDMGGDPGTEEYDPGRFAVLEMSRLTSGNIGSRQITDPEGVVQEGTGGNGWYGADSWGRELAAPIRDWVTAGQDAMFRAVAAANQEREELARLEADATVDAVPLD